MTFDRESMKRKIAALLAKAESTDNFYEADVFMGKVSELLEQYQIGMHELRQDNDPMGHEKGGFYAHDSITWVKFVIHSVARYYGAHAVWAPKLRNTLPYTIYGVESARTTAELMIPYIVSQVRQQARVMAQENPYGYKAPKCEGQIGRALSSRIEEMLVEVKAHRAELESNALVPVNDVKAYIATVIGETKKGKASRAGWGATARDYADKVSLNRQATGGAGRLQIAGSR